MEIGVKQLNKTPARGSLLELLMNSKPHWELLVKILNETHVAQDISVEGFGGIINNITANNYLTFVDEEILVEGRGHNRALHVSIKCLDHIVAKVQVVYYLSEKFTTCEMNYSLLERTCCALVWTAHRLR